MTILVTGGAGFIGSNFVLDWLGQRDEPIVNLDLLTYAGNLSNLASLNADPRHVFQHGDIADRGLVRELLRRHAPRAIVHFAAESHVDRSIKEPYTFVRANVVGTYELLEAAREHCSALPHQQREDFRFLHVSTDEVFGSLGPDDQPLGEGSTYRPGSPYAATKAASDHLVRAWHQTYGLPVLTINCGNNYGPLQFPEKLIPFMIANALSGRSLPVYGDGQNTRDWLYVKDHCSAIRAVLANGHIGETYNVGGHSERTNIEVVHAVCDLLDELRPSSAGTYRGLITYVTDRPGHDRRYAIDASKIEKELAWRPTESFETGIRKTVQWYLANEAWLTAAKGSI